MGYVFRLEDGLRLNHWYQSEPGRSALAIEKEIFHRLWSPLSPQRVLEVGCGTGTFLEWFAEQGHQVTGLDPSAQMLSLARYKLPERVALDRGFAEDLPYPNNAFDTVALITTLEFVDDPCRAIKEACRVAKNHLLIGALNRYSLITWQHCLEGLWKPTVYRNARFFSIFELQHLVENALSGRVPLRWRTCFALPFNTLRYLRFMERCRYLQYNPFGHFIAMRVDLRYPMQTVQDPLLTKVLSGAGANRCQVSTWRTSQGRRKPVIPCHGGPPIVTTRRDRPAHIEAST